MKLFQNFIITFIASTFLLSCTKESDSSNSINTDEIILSRETDYGEDWIYFSFSSGAELSGIDNNNYQTNTNWDIAFNRYNIRTNGGTSGDGEAAVLDLGSVDFDSVTEAPESGYTPDTSIQIVESVATYPPTMITSNGNTVFIGAIEFSGPPPTYNPNNHIYIVKTASGKYVKFWLKGFYNEQGESGYVHFKYSYQDDGTRLFN